MLMDLMLDLGPEEQTSVFIETKPNTQTPVENPVKVSEDDDGVTLTNGIVTLVIGKSGSIIRRFMVGEKEVVAEEDLVDLETLDPEGKIYRASLTDGYEVCLERQNRLRATVLVEGTHTARDGSTFLDFAMRFTLAANHADVKMEHTFYCREQNPAITLVKAIRMIVPTRISKDAVKMLHQAHHGVGQWPRDIEIRENAEIVSSSVGDLNNYRRHYKPVENGCLFVRNLSSFHEDFGAMPFHMRPGGETAFRSSYNISLYSQVYPYLGWQADDLTLVFGMRYWAQLHPKSLVLDENVLTLSFWPEWSTEMRVTQGVSKTHTFWLAPSPRKLTHKEVEQQALQWEVYRVDPLEISFDPAWPAFCEVFDCQHLFKYQPDRYANLENKINPTPGEPSRFTYARNNPTGMFNFGGSGDVNGFTNNEDDSHVYAPLQAYLRTGLVFHLDYGSENALHYMEVDHCDWSTDPRQIGGFIPHCAEHFCGSVYSSHQWAEGVLLYYYLTGDERARKAVIGCGDNHAWWADNNLEQVCCDGREAGMPLVNLAAAYRLTCDDKYIAAAQKIIDGFSKKWYEQWGDLRYPYPQGSHLMWTTGYGDWSTYYGLYRIWEQTGDEEIKTLLIGLLKKLCSPERFGVNDSRSMDFQGVWQYIHLTGDLSVLETLRKPILNFLEKGGHPMRRLHFLKVLDEQGWLKDET